MIVVTGAGGFLGRHVVGALAAEAEEEPVRALDLRFADDFAETAPGVEPLQGDFLDSAFLGPALAGADTVVHLASKNVDRDGSGFEEVNVEGTRRLCALAAAAGVRRMIYVSSVGIYGHGAHTDADESTPVRPDTPFSRSKAAAEDVVLGHHRGGDFRAAVLRHRFVYGDGDQAVVPRLIKAARSYPFWISGGRAEISLIWAPDFAEVVRRMAAGAADAADDPVYHVTDGKPTAYRDVIGAICETFGDPLPRFSIPLPLLYLPVRLRELILGIDPEVASSSVTSIRLKLVAQDNSFSSARLRRLLPDLECVPFAEGFRRSLDFYRRFREGGG